MKQALYVTPPTRRQLLTLRLMILLGLSSMGFFLGSIFSASVRGYAPLYWMLMAAFVFSCLKVVHEWCHYLFITVPVTPPMTRRYTVDIFTTFCAGEPYEMIVETLTAVQAITYPHETYLCDEADDPYLRQVCSQLGVHHVTRAEKINAKAGNINNALSISKGELCVVLDPDHVPFPDFLDPIISHFDNPEIGYVQIVQAYKNNDEGLIAKGAAQQTYQFYGPMMMTMNKYGTVLAIGANCTFRRTALDSIGGHAAGLAEDMHTSMQLHAKGWKSVYVPAVLARGLVPSTLSAYYKQQLKWSRGVFDLFVHVYPKLFGRFTWQQKLHYGVIPLHYMSGFIFLINFLIPIISLVLGVSPMHIDLTDFGLIVLPMAACIILIRHFVQWWVMEDEERGFHVVGGLLLIGTWWIFILGFVYTLAGKKIPYVPTPKDGNEANNWPLNIPNMVVLGASLAAIVYGLYQDLNPYNIIMAGFAGINCFFMCFNIAASRQQQLNVLSHKHPALHSLSKWIKELKGNFWILRRRIYSGMRTAAFLIMILLISLTIYFGIFSSRTEKEERLARENELQMQRLARNNSTDSGLPALFSATGLPLHTKRRPADPGSMAFFTGMRGVNYTKGHNWARRYPAFTRQELEEDLRQMKQTGINTIRHFGPGIYDYNILRATSAQSMDVHYAFWVPEDTDFADDQGFGSLSDEIRETVAALKGKKQIVSWSIGNPVIQKLAKNYSGDELTIKQKAYLDWLARLVKAIKALDPTRPVTADVQFTPETPDLVNLMHNRIPAIDAFGIVMSDTKTPKAILDSLNAHSFISYVTEDAWLQQAQGSGLGVFISNWQDENIAEHVSFDGLKDYSGRPKISLIELARAWGKKESPAYLPEMKILKPAIGTFEGFRLDYHAILKQNGQWGLAGNKLKDVSYEWKLIRTDGFNNPVAMIPLDSGPQLQLTVPKYPSIYRLYLYVVKNGVVMDILQSRLNTPARPTPRSSPN